MTREELEKVVPVHEINGKQAFIRLIDVPNPYRSECYHDHVPANVPGSFSIWLWDWRRWLSTRFSGQYRPRHVLGATVITDEMIACASDRE